MTYALSNMLFSDLNIHTPESPEDGEMGLIYIDGWGYTPNDVRDFISELENLIVDAEAQS